MLVIANVQVPLPSGDQLFSVAEGAINYLARIKVTNNQAVVQELFQMTDRTVVVDSITATGKDLVKVNDVSTINSASLAIAKHCGWYAVV